MNIKTVDINTGELSMRLFVMWQEMKMFCQC